MGIVEELVKIWPNEVCDTGEILDHEGSCKSRMSALSNCSFKSPCITVGFLLQLSCKTLI